ncbi:MAG: hypothetical protein WC835_02495 [Candidatus Paceibacterota bacterium]|jgi:hypothetical protein
MKNIAASVLLYLLSLLFSASSWGQATANSSGTANSAAGNNANEVIVNNGGITFNSISPPGVPMVQLPSLQQPQIFGALQRTPVGASVGVTAGYLKTCRVKFTRLVQPEVRRVEGGSGKTQLVFFPHPSYIALERSAGDIQVEEVNPPTFSSDEIRGVVCLGSMTIFSKDGATTGFETVVADLSRFPFEHMRGVREIVMVAIPAGIASAGGVSSSAKSFGVGGALSHMVSLATAGAITPSFSGGGGESQPSEWLGGTFILLGISNDGKNVLPSDFASLFNPPPPSAGPGNNGAKSEAVKQQ